MRFKLSDIIGLSTILYIAVVLLLNFVVPHSLWFEYRSLHAEDVCQGKSQSITGVRYASVSLPSSGVDVITPEFINISSDRFEWASGRYEKGLTTSTWRTTIHVEPGRYQWRSDVLRLNMLYIFPIYINEYERPVSNVFNVIDCDN